MWDNFDFGIGNGGFGIPVFGGLPTTGSGASTASRIATTDPTWLKVSGLVTDTLKSVLNWKLGEDQVGNGQVPTQNATGSLLNGVGGAGGLGSILLLLLVVVIGFKVLGGLLK
jgi:hypothetical protein